MRHSSCLASLAATVLVGVGLVSFVFMSSDFAAADDQAAKPNSGACACPETQNSNPPNPWARPKVADLRSIPAPHLDESDEIAALDAIRIALTEVADGSTYVWHRHHGHLSGIIQPTQSFKDAAGNVCRHIVTMLTTGSKTEKLEAVACRLADGNWQLDG